MNSQAHNPSGELPLEPDLVAEAVAGDRAALERLLLAHYDTLERRIASKLPARLQSTQAVEDILQLTFLHVFRDIGRFEQRSGATFGDWLARIADNRLYDAIKQHDRQKHGGEMRRLEDGKDSDSRILSLWDWIALDEPSPGSIVARGEALQALQIALASLADDQRMAIQLRMLDEKSLEDTAAALGKSPDAVRGLVHRGKRELADAMGRASLWLKSK
jgi:RNA polymerase sigma-70 factor (ECF subfamily)